MTAVEWLVEQLKINNYISDNAHWLIDEAKEMERKKMEEAWKASEVNMRNTFSSSAYKEVTFKDWFENTKNK